MQVRENHVRYISGAEAKLLQALFNPGMLSDSHELAAARANFAAESGVDKHTQTVAPYQQLIESEQNTIVFVRGSQLLPFAFRQAGEGNAAIDTHRSFADDINFISAGFQDSFLSEAGRGGCADARLGLIIGSIQIFTTFLKSESYVEGSDGVSIVGYHGD